MGWTSRSSGRKKRSPRGCNVPWSAWHVLIGPPLSARDVSREQITPIEGLSALSLDALTSVAYGPEAIIVVLAAAGAGALHLVVPITVGIVALLAILVLSYRQVIEAYPGGGGAYAVALDNFGPSAGLLAAAALVVDYTLTVAVSIAAGVGTLASAFPGLIPDRVPIGLGILALITFLNLRGLGDAARAFLLPTLVFIVGLLTILGIGLIHPLAPHTPAPGRLLLATRGLEPVSILLVLKAFSAGCSALTGVEAIANGVPLFKAPRIVRAKRTELLLGSILAAMLFGVAVLASRWHVVPRAGQTVLSQVMAMAVGRTWVYYLVSLSITVVLALAANTSFGGLPVLASLLARNNYLPHLFAIRDDRQVLAPGIWALAILSAALLVGARGNTLALIPLFAIGVFTGFALAQSGLVVHWRRTRPPHWRQKAFINGLGAVATAIATVIFLLTKFTQGAWVVVLAVPALIWFFTRVHRYYDRVGAILGLGRLPRKPEAKPIAVVVPVTGISRLAEYGLSRALSISKHVVAVTVVHEREGEDSARQRELESQWARWDPGVPLRVLRTEYSSVAGPIAAYVDRLRRRHHDLIVVLIPVAQPEQVRYRILHNHLDLALTAALRTRPDVVVARVPMRIRPTGRDRRRTTRSDDAPNPPAWQSDPRPGTREAGR